MHKHKHTGTFARTLAYTFIRTADDNNSLNTSGLNARTHNLYTNLQAHSVQLNEFSNGLILCTKINYQRAIKRTKLFS